MYKCVVIFVYGYEDGDSNFGKVEMTIVIIIFISRCKAHDQYISTHLSAKDLKPNLLYTNFINVLK